MMKCPDLTREACFILHVSNCVIPQSRTTTASLTFTFKFVVSFLVSGTRIKASFFLVHSCSWNITNKRAFNFNSSADVNRSNLLERKDSDLFV